MTRILTEGQKEFKAWANDPELVATYLEARKKFPAPENNMDWWIKNGTPEQLRDYIANYKSKNQKKKEQKIEGADILYDDGRWLCMHVKTYEVAKQYGSGTCWCITGRYPGHESRGQYYFDSYLSSEYTGYYFVIDRQGTDDNGQGGKWCVCPAKNGKEWTIWDSKDGTPRFIPNVPGELKIPGVKSLAQFTILSDGTLVGIMARSRWDRDVKLNIPENVKKIKNKLFFNDNTLSEIVLPEGLEELGSGVFGGCDHLEQVRLPKSCHKIGSGCFIGCENLRSVSAKGITEVPNLAFAYCPDLTAVAFDHLETLHQDAFKETDDCSIECMTISDSARGVATNAGVELLVLGDNNSKPSEEEK